MIGTHLRLHPLTSPPGDNEAPAELAETETHQIVPPKSTFRKMSYKSYHIFRCIGIMGWVKAKPTLSRQSLLQIGPASCRSSGMHHWPGTPQTPN